MPTARLAVALAHAGFSVEALCPLGHAVNQTHAASRIHRYYGLAPLRSVDRAIAASKPDLVLPGDDLAARHLHDLYRRSEFDSRREDFAPLLERSLGSPEYFPIIHSRAAFMELARQEGVRVPETTSG